MRIALMLLKRDDTTKVGIRPGLASCHCQVVPISTAHRDYIVSYSIIILESDVDCARESIFVLDFYETVLTDT